MSGISKFFESYEVRALTDVSLEVRRGEVFGLVGPARSGKTTALRILAGRLRPTEGRVRAFGRSLRLASTRARIGCLLASPGSSGASGWLGFLGKLFAGSQAGRGRTGNSVAVQTQRRGRLAQVFAKNVDLVILDEPFSGLDGRQRRELAELIVAMKQRGKTVIYTSRLLSEVRTLCDRVAIFYEGKVQASGTLEDLLIDLDAVRFTAPVLPQVISEHVLEVIREELARVPEFGGRAVEPAAGPASESLPDRAHSVPGATGPASQSVLAPLVAASARAASQDTSVSGAPGAEPDCIDHQKLAKLTSPVTEHAKRPKEP